LNGQPFISHLEELRLRIIYSVLGIISCSILSFFFHKPIFAFLASPLKKDLIFIAPHEAFLTALKVSLLSGIIFSSPFTMYHVWRFVGCALKKNEKKILFKYVPAGLILFIAGVFFGFLVVLPAGLNFLLDFGGETLTPMLTVGKYISFVFLLVLVFGITFQVPLAMRMLTSIGIVEKSALRRSRRYAVVTIFVIAALLTPPDVFTQIALAFPIILLYEIGIIFSKDKKVDLKG
jgi:sec-independent protein translocase protein TatC